MMTDERNFLAIDLGAESGRTILGTLADERIVLTETHRFLNGPVRLPDGLHWDVLRQWAEIKKGIAATVKDGMKLASLGVDTWAVDFALLDEKNALLGIPFHYRDARTDGMMDEAFRRMPRDEIYAYTGIQFLQLNTLYQLLAMVTESSPILEIARTFVTIPDLINYWLSGEITNEFTNSTTTQFLDPIKKDWSWPVLEAMGIPVHLFGSITASGTELGTLLPEIAGETGAGDVKIVVPACHDTGSAVVAVPAQNQDFAWLSSGTWSIMGVEVKAPVINAEALRYNFTNEGGVFDTWRFSKNIMGLWLVQECRREWQGQGREYSYGEITKLAEDADPFIAVIEPDDDLFFHPGDMPEKIRAYCQNTGQQAPDTDGEVVRVALESLALKYRWVLERLEELTSKQFSPIHTIGGGSQNRLLNQFTSNATRRNVVSGPVEATAIGNLLMQAIGLGELNSLADARKVVRNSFDVEDFQPQNSDDWDKSYSKLLELLERKVADD